MKLGHSNGSSEFLKCSVASWTLGYGRTEAEWKVLFAADEESLERRKKNKPEKQ